MKNIFCLLRKHIPAVLLALCLLVVQAVCDLSLPQYTSDIVDTGLQQSGIADAVPDSLRADSLADLELFMDEEAIANVERAYTRTDGIWQLNPISKADRTQLDADFSVPMVLVYQCAQNPAYHLEQIKAAVQAGAMTRDGLLAMRDQALSHMGELSDSMVSQIAVQYIKGEYQAMGRDLYAMQRSYLLLTGAKMLGMTLLMIVVSMLVGLIASRTGAAVSRDLRRDVFARVVSYSSAEINQFSTASLITRSTNDIQQIQMVLVMLLRMVLYAPILGIGGIIKVASTHSGLSWIIAVAVGIILGVVGMLMCVAMPKFKRMQTLVDNLNRVSREILTGIMPIRAFSREKHEEERFSQANDELMRTQLFTNRVMTLMMPLMMSIMFGVMAAIIWFGAWKIDDGVMQVGTLTAFITYTMQIVMAFMMIAMISIMLPRAGVAADRIIEVVHTQPTIHDPEHARRIEQPKGVVTFDDVSFAFPDSATKALEHISFTAQPGQTTAIIGSTGCGKSTLLSLIPRFYDATEGSVCIDGVDVRDLSQHDLHALLGYVPQKGVLFSGDIASNIKFGGDDISDARMEQAARIAQAQEFIAEKSEGYQSAIAQGGSNVSGGQKQRLSIARAIACNPQIYLFDDSFSALDYKTDAVLRHALHDAVEQATVLIVAQRISTILHADQILVLDEGRIVGRGTHSELMHTCETYREIARSQLSEQELAQEGVTI